MSSAAPAPSATAVVVVGSTNSCKVDAVAQVLREYPVFEALEVVGFKAASGIPEQPRGLEQTLRGARNRAYSAYGSRDHVALALGIESGVYQVGSDLFDSCACVAFDGSRENVGWSSAFKIPESIRAHVDAGKDLTQASNAAGVSGDPKLGEGQGLIGVLSCGRIDRLEYTKQAVTTAMIGIDRRDLYAAEAAPPHLPAEPAQGRTATYEALLNLVQQMRDEHEQQRDDFQQALEAQANQHAQQHGELLAVCESLLNGMAYQDQHDHPSQADDAASDSRRADEVQQQ